jgi:splicing factor U2AF subunit
MDKNMEEIDENKLCSFYTKNGACRYGNQCTKLHIRPRGSLTLLFAHLYKNPPLAIALADGQPVPDEKIAEVVEHLETWYQEIFIEIANYGEIREMHICDNLGDHLIGNIYVKFATPEDAENVMKNISRRYYRDRLVMPEYSPVTDFEEGSCRNFSKGGCKRGGSCNFLHIKMIRKELKKALFKKMFKDNPHYLERYKKSKKDKKHKKEKKDKKKHKKDKSKKIKKRKDKKKSYNSDSESEKSGHRERKSKYRHHSPCSREEKGNFDELNRNSQNQYKSEDFPEKGYLKEQHEKENSKNYLFDQQNSYRKMEEEVKDRFIKEEYRDAENDKKEQNVKREEFYFDNKLKQDHFENNEFIKNEEVKNDLLLKEEKKIIQNPDFTEKYYN